MGGSTSNMYNQATGSQGGAFGTGFMPGGVQKGFGPAPIEQNPMDAADVLGQGINSAFGGIPGMTPLLNTVNQGINTAVGPTLGPAFGSGFGGGKSGGQMSPGPQQGFGMDPATGLPYGGGQNPGQILGSGIDSILGVTPIGGAFNQALGGQSLGNVVGNSIGGALGGSPLGGMGNQPASNAFDPSGMQRLGWSGASPAVLGWQPPKAYKDAQGRYFDDKGNSLTYTPGSSGNQDWNNKFGTLKNAQGQLYGGGQFGGGKSGMFNQIAQSPQFTQAPTPMMGGMGSFTNVPAPMQQAMGGSLGMPGLTGQVMNRFIPPNAPGASARRPSGNQVLGAAGVPVQQARTVQPNRFTRTRPR